MKKLAFLVLAAALISGAAWGQTGAAASNVSDDFKSGYVIDGTETPVTVGGLSITSPGLFDSFYAPETLSTESRYSAGIFSSYVDDFIDVNFYDPEVGTFFFLGGFPSDGANQRGTNELAGATSDPAYAVNFGFAKSLNNLYLAIYYGGSFVNSKGEYQKGNGGKEDADSDTNWRNRLAVTVGTASFGAFRLDAIVDTDTTKHTYDSKTTTKNRTDGPSFALTWGGIQVAGLDPYVTLGYRFSDLVVGQNAKQGETTISKDGRFGIQAGVNKDLDETASVFADIGFLYRFAENHAGFDSAAANGDIGGGLGIGLRAGYKQTLNFGKVSVGFKPNIAAGYLTASGKNLGTNGNDVSVIEVGLGTDLGLKYAHNEKFSVYTGASLGLFDWLYATSSGTGGDGSWYRITGMEWDTSRWGGSPKAATNLGIGATFTPAPGLSIGAGLNTILDKFVVVDLTDMTVQAGTFFDNSGANNLGDWATNLVRDVKFDLTVSYQF